MNRGDVGTSFSSTNSKLQFQEAQCFFYNGTARWFGPDLQCLPIDCGEPEDILNGRRDGECTSYRCQVNIDMSNNPLLKPDQGCTMLFKELLRKNLIQLELSFFARFLMI